MSHSIEWWDTEYNPFVKLYGCLNYRSAGQSDTYYWPKSQLALNWQHTNTHNLIQSTLSYFEWINELSWFALETTTNKSLHGKSISIAIFIQFRWIFQFHCNNAAIYIITYYEMRYSQVKHTTFRWKFNKELTAWIGFKMFLWLNLQS